MLFKQEVSDKPIADKIPAADVLDTHILVVTLKSTKRGGGLKPCLPL